MKNPLPHLGGLQFLPLLLLLLYTSSWSRSWQGMAMPSMQLHHNFLNCLNLHSLNSTSISDVVHTPQNSSYQSIFDLTAHNIRFTGPTAKKPLLIITPTQIAHIQAAIICSKQHSLEIRVRSGGHDLEGLSFVSSHDEPFFLLDMTNFRSIDIDVEDQVAWVQVAALLGELYYKIAEKSENLGFPAGIGTTVGVGGHLSGGGYGTLLRKYGLAADNIIDAELVDADGRLLNRKSMGEDLFWAIRGGGGGSFGVIIAFKIQLVHVPSKVTLCSIIRTPKLHNATGLVYDWQFIAPNLPEEVFSLIFMTQAANTSSGTTVEAKKTAQALFLFVFLGGADDLITLLHHRCPKLEASNENCEEMSWIESVLVIAGLSRETPREALLDRTISTDLGPNRYHGKVKSDYVQKPIPEIAIDEIWKRLSEDEEARMFYFYFVAYGGKMGEIPETEIPFPHRSGNLFMVGYLLYWEEEKEREEEEEEGVAACNRHLEWMRKLYHFMEPYVSKSPRQSYLNYRDLDIGTNRQSGTTSFEEASNWGFKYFKNNFHKLAQVKAKVDPTNLFRTEQSIPVLPIWWTMSTAAECTNT